MARPTLIVVIFVLILILSFVGYMRFSKTFLGIKKQHISLAEGERSYALFLPSSYSPAKEYPLVMVLHGSNANSSVMASYTRFHELAEKEDFILAYPEKSNLLDWRIKDYLQLSPEIDYIDAVMADIAKQHHIDPGRIFVAGYSSGGFLTEMLACSRLATRIKAFAAVTSSMRMGFLDNCQKETPVSFLMINADKDPYFPWNGNQKDLLSVSDSLNFWLEHEECLEIVPSERALANINIDDASRAERFDYNCPNDSRISLVKITGAGHTWPGSSSSPRIKFFLGETNQDFSANSLIWHFFSL